jgi:hypothetical protein
MDLRRHLYGPATKVLPATFFEKRQAQQALDDYRRAGIAFIHVPRTAGFSVLQTVYQSEILRHFTIRQFLDVSCDDVRRLPRFAVARNPWDRAVSAYTLATLGGVPGGAQMLHPQQYDRPEFATFDSFVHGYLAVRNAWKLDGVFKPQVYYLGSPDLQNREMHHVGLFHRLPETEEWLSETLGRDIQLELSNQTPRRAYQDYYTDATREIVRRIYSEDIERFGFEFEH